ncbi:transcriptional repressor [Ornithinimicrobium sp. INDO-MA30-4]|nr:transcriptional repressor [Ornithinimicrobium sp. INDO-MA30-4]UJH71558.1 transcriptional repressor [Ornithinimicrobium sp. INDO-MA30-4]
MLEESGDFKSAQDLHAKLRAEGQTVGLATVYRTLTALADQGDVDVLRTDDGESVYRSCSTGHHHHLVCRECGRTVEIEGPTVEQWTELVAAEHGFTQTGHTLRFLGLRPALSARASWRCDLSGSGAISLKSLR